MTTWLQELEFFTRIVLNMGELHLVRLPGYQLAISPDYKMAKNKHDIRTGQPVIKTCQNGAGPLSGRDTGGTSVGIKMNEQRGGNTFTSIDTISTVWIKQEELSGA